MHIIDLFSPKQKLVMGKYSVLANEPVIARRDEMERNIITKARYSQALRRQKIL